jgi:uncharacterized protein YndB with AHSA1/START domain
VSATREIEIEATPEEVWEALADEERRAVWLDEPGRTIWIAETDEPRRLVWHWSDGFEQPTRVEIDVIEIPGGSRVYVTESRVRFPLATFAASFALVAA